MSKHSDEHQFQATILTLFPEMFPGTLGHSLAGRALDNGVWSLITKQIREFATDKHKTVDDAPLGGGHGLILKPDVVSAALDDVAKAPGRRLYMSPRGVPLSQNWYVTWHKMRVS